MGQNQKSAKDYAHFSIRGTVESLTYTPKSCRITVVAQEPGTGDSASRPRYYRNYLVTFNAALISRIRKDFRIGERAFFSGTIRTKSNKQERIRAGNAVMVVHYAALIGVSMEPLKEQAQTAEVSPVMSEERDRARLEIIAHILQHHAYDGGLRVTADNLPGLVMTAYDLMSNYMHRSCHFTPATDERLLVTLVGLNTVGGEDIVHYINEWPT